jgi:hypothetical protein
MSIYNNVAHQTEFAERLHLAQEQRQRLERHAKRCDKLRKDPGSTYHSYNEVLKYFPLSRGEQSNQCLVGLLANQLLPAEPTSDWGLAIRHAKEHWQCYWELRDLECVVAKAKKGREEDYKARWKCS